MKIPAGRCQYLLGYLLSLVGVYTTWMLSLSYLLHIKLPCGASDDCTTVALSPASRILGIPVPLFGLVFYVVLAAISAICFSRLVLKGSFILYPLSVFGAAISTMFTFYSTVAVNAHCWWCVVSNVTACILAIVYGFDRRGVNCVATLPGSSWLICIPMAVVVASMIWTSTLVRASAERFPWNPEALAATAAVELMPSDSITVNGEIKSPAIVMFLDLECDACHEAFQAIYPLVLKRRLRVVFRHFPSRRHRASFALAVLSEEASQQGRGLDFVAAAFERRILSRKAGEAVLASLRSHESPEMLKVAQARVRRDRSLALRLGLAQTPSFFLADLMHPTRASTLDQVMTMLRESKVSP